MCAQLYMCAHWVCLHCILPHLFKLISLPSSCAFINSFTISDTVFIMRSALEPSTSKCSIGIIKYSYQQGVKIHTFLRFPHGSSFVSVTF